MGEGARRGMLGLWAGLPTFLKWWVAVVIASFAGVFINPTPLPLARTVYRIVFWAVIAALIAHGMYRHSRVAWSAALVLAGLDLFFALPPSVGLIPPPGSNAGRTLVWSGWAAIAAVAQLVILTLSGTRAWISAEPIVE